jgi:hypothetical protein
MPCAIGFLAMIYLLLFLKALPNPLVAMPLYFLTDPPFLSYFTIRYSHIP